MTTRIPKGTETLHAWRHIGSRETTIEGFLEHIDRVNRRRGWAEEFKNDRMTLGSQECDFFDPFVFELGDIRSLLANWGYVQSAMSVREPFRLMLEYTQTMMAFLLFNPDPRSIEMIGLGGGSLAKYCHEFLPASSVRAVEIDWKVIALADQFCIPIGSDRLEIIWDDGANFVAHDKRKTDVLFVDGFDIQGQPRSLCSRSFYKACQRRLNPKGILVINMCNQEAVNLTMLDCLRSIFAEIITTTAEEGMNLVVFAGDYGSLNGNNRDLFKCSESLKQCHPLPLASLAQRLTIARAMIEAF